MRFHLFFLLISAAAFSQKSWPHLQAHAHNDYAHDRPLMEALENGFNSVEADVHLRKNKLLVGHAFVTKRSPWLEMLYFIPLDSLIKKNHGFVYEGARDPFLLMIDIKTDATQTHHEIRKLMDRYPALKCKTGSCPVKVFLSGNRPVEIITSEPYDGLSLDGRSEDLGKGYSTETMPVISDRYDKWSQWNGKREPLKNELQEIRELASRVHEEGKLFRLWAIPDNELAWEALIDAGVDLINTDKLAELNTFLVKRNKAND